jgi:hypothetical protein
MPLWLMLSGLVLLSDFLRDFFSVRDSCFGAFSLDSFTGSFSTGFGVCFCFWDALAFFFGGASSSDSDELGNLFLTTFLELPFFCAGGGAFSAETDDDDESSDKSVAGEGDLLTGGGFDAG